MAEDKGVAQKNYVVFGVYLAAFVALLDQISKKLVLMEVDDYGAFMPLLPFLNLHISLNKGVTFGLFHNFGTWMPYILIVTALVILGFLFNWLLQAEKMISVLGLGCIMGGAIGNVIDRIRFGAVIDFIDFHIGSYHWYTFNVADSAIVLGVGLLLLENYLLKRQC